MYVHCDSRGSSRPARTCSLGCNYLRQAQGLKGLSPQIFMDLLLACMGGRKCSCWYKAIYLGFQKWIHEGFAGEVVYSWNKKKHVLLTRLQDGHTNYFIIQINSSITHSLLCNPSSPVQNSHGLLLLMGFLHACLIFTACSRAWVAGTSCQMWAGKRPVRRCILAQYGPWPSHYTDWTAAQYHWLGLGTYSIASESSDCPAIPPAKTPRQHCGNLLLYQETVLSSSWQFLKVPLSQPL